MGCLGLSAMSSAIEALGDEAMSLAGEMISEPCLVEKGGPRKPGCISKRKRRTECGRYL